MVSDLISHRLQTLYQSCLVDRNRCTDRFFRLDRKSVLRLFTTAFPYENIDHITGKLKERLEEKKRYLEEAKNSGILKDHHIYIDNMPRNAADLSEKPNRILTLSPKLTVGLFLSDVSIWIHAQINYYDINKELPKLSNVIELIKNNLLAIGYEASSRFIDHLYDYYGNQIST